MSRRKTPSSAHDLVWLSGWVFADLLLGLAVIFLAGTRGSSFLEIAALTPTVPGPTVTPYPTYTPGPSPTAYPTYTPGPSPTTYPTYTPPAAPTAYPTYTPGPSPTAYPTYTPGPSATPYPTYTPGPQLPAGLDQSPYTVSLRTDPSLFLSTNANDRASAESQFRAQIHACLDSAAGSRAGLLLGTGYNPDVTNGHALAKRVMGMMRGEIPGPFNAAVQKDYHALTSDPLLNGSVTVEIYFVASTQASLPRNLLGARCTPPPKTWCQGPESARALVVYNWDVLPFLSFTLDNRIYTIKSAKGTTPDGDNRTVGCIMVSPGRHTWRADQVSATLNVDANRDPDPVRLCNSPAQLCPGGQGPMTPAPGIQ